MDRLPTGFAEVVRLLDRVSDQAGQSLVEVRFLGDKQEHAHFLALMHMSLIEFSRGLSALMQAQVFSAVPILFRAALEVYVDFENLLRDYGYINRMGYRHFARLVKVHENAEKMPSLAAVLRAPAYEGQRKFARSKFDELKAIGADKGQRMEARLAAIGRESELWPHYWQTSLAAHSPLGELEKRHDLRVLSNGTISAAISSPKGAQECVHWGFFAALYVINTMQKFYDFIGHADGGLSDKLFEEARGVGQVAGLE